jgi:Domain of unknown function (DUF4365)
VIALPSRRRKKVTRQTLIGEGGIAIIARRVNEMGYLYHDRRVDHGIDGEIELVDPNGDALNLVVMVQSKASTRPGAFETTDSFQWTADPADLDYWLSGNAPVIVVLSRPADDLAWWFDVRAEFGDPRRRAERTVTISKRNHSFDKSAAAAIMRIGMPRDSGIFLASPPKRELLTSNLLPIEAWPDTLFIAPAAVADYAEGWERLKKTRDHAAGWILHDGLVISFGDLRTSPLQALCDGGVERHESADWATSDDDKTVYQFADLLRRTLVSDRGRDVQWHQARHHVHFRATDNRKRRVVGRGNGKRGRTVFGPHYSKTEPERVSYYHHAALSPRFRRIDGAWFCLLGVDYCFTRDGKNEASFSDSLLAGIKRLERHPAVIGWTRMWEGYLQGDLLTGDSLLTFGSLLTFEVHRGIDDAWWGPAPAGSADDDIPEAVTNADLDRSLDYAGVDEDDLLSLLAETPGLARSPARQPVRSHQRASKTPPRSGSSSVGSSD